MFLLDLSDSDTFLKFGCPEHDIAYSQLCSVDHNDEDFDSNHGPIKKVSEIPSSYIRWKCSPTRPPGRKRLGGKGKGATDRGDGRTETRARTEEQAKTKMLLIRIKIFVIMIQQNRVVNRRYHVLGSQIL